MPSPPHSANTSASAAKTSTQSSYSAMSVGDVEAIGAHCQMAFCHQLDFLPFKCESCKGKFCLDHRTETAHACPQAGAWARARQQQATSKLSNNASLPRKPNILTHEQQCSSPSCKTLINTPLTPGVDCTRCRRTYCLKHRLQEDHDCAKLTPLGIGNKGSGSNSSNDMNSKGMAALQKLRAWGVAKQKAAVSQGKAAASAVAIPSRSSKDSNVARTSIAEINALKRSAKGDEKIPTEKRIYIHVEASADTTTAKFPTGKFFYSADWSVGRVLDTAARALQVENINNHGGGEEERLRIFHVEGGRLLDFSEKLGKVVATGNTIVLLRGVGPPIPDLIEP